jgi:uncharacterized protein (TIGR02231 family)
MKKNLILLLYIAMPALLWAQSKDLKSTIEQVTVFTRGAELQHNAATSVETGKQTIVFTGLSAEMDPNSVLLEIEPRNVTILSVNSKTNYLNPIAENKKISELRDSLATVNRRLQELNYLRGSLYKEQELLYRNEAIGGTSNNVPIAEIEKAANFFRLRSQDISKQFIAIDEELGKLNFKQQNLNSELSVQNSKVNPPTSDVTVVISSNSKQNITLKLKYMVFQAGWAPRYDVRASSNNEPVLVNYRANVFNNCGLDWNNVVLKLSTADPLQGAEKPKLATWDVAAEQTIGRQDNIAQGYIKTQEIQLMSSVPGIAYSNSSSDYLKQKDNKPVEFQNIEIAELSAEFDIPEPYSISADNKPYLVDVTDFKLPAKFEHYAAPKVDADAFLVAKITGWNELNLITGKASVYYNGNYLGQSMINTSSIEDTLILSLGRDKKIAVTRKKESELSKHQFMGNNEKETFYFKTNLRNNRDSEVTITLEDQLPISSKGEIVVDALDLSGGEVDKNTGKVTWTIVLKPGESKEIQLGYSIKSPKGIVNKKSKFRSVAAPSF